MSRANNAYEMDATDWAEFEEDFAICVEMMAQSLDGRTPNYQQAKRAVDAERRAIAELEAQKP